MRINALVEGDFLRVYPISKFTGLDKSGEVQFETLNYSEGLAIEKKQGDYCYVIAFVRPDEDGICLEDVDFRTITMYDECKDEVERQQLFDEYQNCVKFAKQVLVDIYRSVIV